jgi:GntR family transcriptional regulator/MocR family aminotransferase
MRTLYGARREMLIEALRAAPLDIDAPETGMHFVGWLSDGISDQNASQRAAGHQVRVLPVSTFVLEHQVRDGLILGYANVDEAEIWRGAEGLMRALAF